MGKLKGGEFTFDPTDMVEKTIGSFVIEPGDGDVPDPIFFSKACRQLGIPSQAQPFVQDDKESIRARLPVMPKQTYESVLKRAEFLLEREAQGLPTEQLPSGRWPDSLDEFADQVPVVIAKDEDKASVYLDFGRPVQAIGVSPAMARTIATLIMTAANEMDPDGEMGNRPELVNVARLKVPGMEQEQEGTVELPGVFAGITIPKGASDKKQWDKDVSADEAWAQFEAGATGVCIGLCESCEEPQYMSPGGEVCKNGHGGAPSIRPCWACAFYFCKAHTNGHPKCQEQPKGPGLDPAQNKNHDCHDWAFSQARLDFIEEHGEKE